MSVQSLRNCDTTRSVLYCVCDHETLMNFKIALFFTSVLEYHRGQNWNDFFIRGPFLSADSFDGFTWSAEINKSCEQVMSRSTSLNLAGPCRTKLRVQTLRSGQVLMNRMVQTSQL